MYTSIALLVPFLSVVLGAAYPAPTLAARSPEHYQDRIKLFELERRAAALYSRQKAGELLFCFGRNSICAKSNDLNDECDKFYGARDSQQWYECLCSNGYVSTREACGWCNDAWGISQIGGINDLNSRQCTSHSVSIAPVPQSIIQLQSSYNATWTGTLLGTGSIGTKTGSETGRATSSAATTTSRSGGVGSPIGGNNDIGKSSSADDDSFTRTLDGGGNIPAVTRTIFGGQITPAPTGINAANGGNVPGAGYRTGTSIGLSMLAFAFSGICLL